MGLITCYACHKSSQSISIVLSNSSRLVHPRLKLQQSLGYSQTCIERQSSVVEDQIRLLLGNGDTQLGSFSVNKEDIDIDAFDRVCAVNLRGPLLCTKHAAKAMIPQKKGVILATSSVAASLGGAGPLAYSMNKAGLLGMLKSASFELGKYGIRVNSVSPAGVPTPMSRRYWGEGVGDSRTDEELAVVFSSGADLKGAVLMAEDVARAALFLASDEAQFVSGHNLVVDGGFSVTKGYVLTGFEE